MPAKEKLLNSFTKELKELLIIERNRDTQKYLEEIDTTAATDYSLWKSTQSLKSPIQQNCPIIKPDVTWAKTNAKEAECFVKHLSQVLVSDPDKAPAYIQLQISSLLNEAPQMDLPLRKCTKR